MGHLYRTPVVRFKEIIFAFYLLRFYLWAIVTNETDVGSDVFFTTPPINVLAEVAFRRRKLKNNPVFRIGPRLRLHVIGKLL